MKLPAYPWQHKRFWLEASSVTAATAAGGYGPFEHPLLGYRLPELARLPDTFIWQNKVDATFRRELQKRGFDAATALPDEAYREMAQAAAQIALGDRLHALREMSTHQPLPVAIAEPTIQFILTRQDHDTASFEVFSRGDVEDAWHCCVTGRLALSTVERSWLYEVAWQPQPRESALGERAHGTWLVFSDEDGAGPALAALLAERGGTPILVTAGNAYTRTAAGHYTVDPSQPEHFRQLLDEVSPSCRGAIYLWGLSAPSIDAVTTSDLQQAHAHHVGGVLHLIQAIARTQWPPRGTPRLWLVTRHAQRIQLVTPAGRKASTGASSHPTLQLSLSSLWGLGRVISIEHPEMWGGLIDIDAETDAPTLLAEIAGSPGDDHIAFRNDQRYVARMTHFKGAIGQPAPIRSDAAYLITGGLGGLGLRVAQWLVAQGARHIALMGRSDGTPQAQTAARALEQAGAQVIIVRGDVSRPNDAARALAEIAQTMPPLRGIIHAAGTIEDAVLIRQDWASFARVLASKVEGAWNLHTLTAARSEPLDFFVLFSSASALLGTPGQGNYAAANAFLDALAHYRCARGLPAQSINWGRWADVGLAAQADRGAALSRLGIEPMSPDAGIAALERVMGSDAPQVAVLAIDWATFVGQLPRGARTPFVAEFAYEVEDAAAEPDGQGSEFLHQLEAAAPEARFDRLHDLVRHQAAVVMRFGADHPLDPNRGFFQLGMDSLMAVELKNRLQNSLGCSLRSTLAFDYPTVTTLTSYLIDRLFPPAAPAPGVETMSPHDTIAAQVKDLSRDEVKTLLDQELQALSEGL